jgi:hypothetical protein
MSRAPYGADEQQHITNEFVSRRKLHFQIQNTTREEHGEDRETKTKKCFESDMRNSKTPTVMNWDVNFQNRNQNPLDSCRELCNESHQTEDNTVRTKQTLSQNAIVSLIFRDHTKH